MFKKPKSITEVFILESNYDLKVVNHNLVDFMYKNTIACM